MFRDTFAVELLLAGVPLDQVSLLLAHSSIKVTEKHYAPFVKARQLQVAPESNSTFAAVDERLVKQGFVSTHGRRAEAT